MPTTLEASVSATATRSLDVDGDGKVTAFGDGLMVIRRLFGSAFSGEDLTSKAISPDSLYANEEEPWVAVAANIDALM